MELLKLDGELEPHIDDADFLNELETVTEHEDEANRMMVLSRQG